MAASESQQLQTHGDDSLYPIAVLIDELRNEDVQVILNWFEDPHEQADSKNTAVKNIHFW